MRSGHPLLIFGSLALSSLVAICPTNAQIIPDATLPINSIVRPEGNANVITGGTAAGANLFHSFSSFSVPTGSSAYFNNALDIQNIITRVTGGSISNIDGLIKANGRANLFLINPNGIIFGPNAQLNIGGSFFGSTANSVKFADGSSYSATNPNAPPLLTINVPIGLQFGPNPGKIVVQGSGNNIRIDESNFQTEAADLYVMSDRPVGLQVNPGQTLALVGGEIVLDGGNLTAADGGLELGSVATAGEVSLTPSSSGWTLGYSGVQNFSDIRFLNSASADTSGEGGGSIQIQGRQLFLEKGSAILALTLGAQPGGNIDIRTTDSVQLSGSSSQGLYSLIVTQSYLDSTGNAGNINIETGKLLLNEGGLIFSSTFGPGNAGSVNVRAGELVELSGVDPDGLGSFLGTATPENSQGNAGNLTIETGRLILKDGALVSSATNGAGTGGTLTVRASELVELSGGDGFGAGSTLKTEAGVGSTGNAGNLTIETGRLIARDGASISAGTAGAGNAGSLTIKATDSVEVTGTSASGFIPTALSTSVLPGATGAGSDLTLETGKVRVGNGALISTITSSASSAGNLRINAADSVDIIGSGAYVEIFQRLLSFSTGAADLRNGLFTTSFGGGNAGNIEINTSKFTISNGAFVITSTAAFGQGGTLTINASDSVELNSAALVTGNRPGSTGGAGDITINTQNLRMLNLGAAVTGTAGGGRGGNLIVNASESVEMVGGNPFFLAGAPANTTLNTTTISPANAGDVKITTKRLTLRDGATISASTFGPGRGGTLEVNATDSITAIGTTPDRTFPTLLYTSSAGSGDAGDIRIAAGNLILQNGAAIGVDSRASGSAGNLEIDARSLLLDAFSNLNAQTAAGNRGNITVNSPDIQLRRASNITTNATGTATGGNITLNTDTLAALENSDITANAQQGAGGQVTITARGIFGTEFRSRPSPLTSDITASSELGAQFSGVVQINTPDVNPASGLVQLQSDSIDVSKLIVSGCEAFRDSSFVLTGKGGLPPNPHEPLTSSAVVVDWATLEGRRQTTQGTREDFPALNSQSPIVEATGFAKSPDGKIVLTANLSTATLQAPWYQQANCASLAN